MHTSDKQANVAMALTLGDVTEFECVGEREREQSPLRKALKDHFAAFDGLTEAAKAAPIYKDTTEAQKHGNAA